MKYIYYAGFEVWDFMKVAKNEKLLSKYTQRRIPVKECKRKCTHIFERQKIKCHCGSKWRNANSQTIRAFLSRDDPSQKCCFGYMSASFYYSFTNFWLYQWNQNLNKCKSQHFKTKRKFPSIIWILIWNIY